MKTTATSTNLDIGNDITYEDSSLERYALSLKDYLINIPTVCIIKHKKNAMAIIDFILSLKTEINLSSHHIKNNIMVLTLLSQFIKTKNRKKMTRDDVLSHLHILRKPESADHLHK